MITAIRQSFHHQGFRKYFFNTGWLIAERVVRLLVGLFVGVYVARYLGPERFGILSFAMSFVALFGALATLGLDGIIVRNTIQNPESRDELLGTAFGLRLFGGLVLLGLVFEAVQLTNSDPQTQLIVMIIAAGQLFQAFQVIELYFQSQVLARLTSIANMGALILSSAIKLLLIWFGVSLFWFALAIIIESGLKGLLLSILYVNQRKTLRRWQFRFRQARLLLKDSWPLIFSGLVIMVYMRIDQVMIKIMLDNQAVGKYAAAVKLSEVWYFLPMIISQSLFPAILNAKKHNEDLYYNRLQKLYDLMVWLAIGVALMTTFLSVWIVTLLFGQEYREAGGVLAIYIWAGIAVFFGSVWSKWILAENDQRIVVYFHVIALITNIVLNFILIQIFGLYGAAWSTTLSYSISQLSGLLIYNHKRSLKMFFLTLLAPVRFFREEFQI